MTSVQVTFTETILRHMTFDIDLEGAQLRDLQCSDLHELMDDQKVWDQVPHEAWLRGDIEDRVIDDFQEEGS